MEEYKRICPKCGRDIIYKTKKILAKSIKLGKPCKNCVQKICNSGKNNSMFGKKHSDETKEKIREKRKLQSFSKETRDKMSISAKQRLEEYNHWLGRKHSDESKNKMRIVAANRINNNCWHPSYNMIACEIIEKYGKENGYNFQHAMNGGEFFINELGFWLDGYDKEKNVGIEYYETAHKYSIEKDEIRIKKIKEQLNCEIIILKEEEEIMKDDKLIKFMQKELDELKKSEMKKDQPSKDISDKTLKEQIKAINKTITNKIQNK